MSLLASLTVRPSHSPKVLKDALNQPTTAAKRQSIRQLSQVPGEEDMSELILDAFEELLQLRGKEPTHAEILDYIASRNDEKTGTMSKNVPQPSQSETEGSKPKTDGLRPVVTLARSLITHVNSYYHQQPGSLQILRNAAPELQERAAQVGLDASKIVRLIESLPPEEESSESTQAVVNAAFSEFLADLKQYKEKS